MASLTTRKTGSRFIGISTPGGATLTIPLGRMPLRTAQAVRSRVNELHAAKLAGHAVDDDTSRWLAKIDDTLHAKLAKAGLVAPRVGGTLGAWLRSILAEKADDLKPASLAKLRQTVDKLIGREAAPGRRAVAGFFRHDVPLRSIGEADAAAWRAALRKARLSEAAVKTHCGNAKTLLAPAVRRKLIPDNPFIDLPSGATASTYSRYIDVDEIERVIEQLPTAEWKLLFGLARYAGLRVPSESHGLTWADVDWDRGRLTVRSPKTERHAGHGVRVVPIVPELRKLLMDRFEECEPGEALVTLTGRGTLTKMHRRACARAGIVPWERAMQTLRSSCEQWLATMFPQYVVSAWLGHSLEVSGRHYLGSIPDELFGKAARCAQRPAQRAMHETLRNERKTAQASEDVKIENAGDFQRFPKSSDAVLSAENWAARDLNP